MLGYGYNSNYFLENGDACFISKSWYQFLLLVYTIKYGEYGIRNSLDPQGKWNEIETEEIKNLGKIISEI